MEYYVSIELIVNGIAFFRGTDVDMSLFFFLLLLLLFGTSRGRGDTGTSSIGSLGDWSVVGVKIHLHSQSDAIKGQKNAS